MKNKFQSIAALALGVWINIANATPLTGEAVVLDNSGDSGDEVFTTSITGELDLATNTMTVEWADLFFGMQVNTTLLELLGEGTYTRPDGGGFGTITATVNPGQLGGYFELTWSFNTFRTFMVWDVVESSDGGEYTTVDSDGDGIPGHALTAGPFVGITLIYNFIVGTPPPDIGVTINAAGGPIQECSEPGGSVISLSAAIDLVGGAELGSIEWFLDGESAGSGQNIMPFLALGAHTVDVLATAVSGESDTDSVPVTVLDTTPPDLDVAFVNQAGEPVSSISSGNYVTARITPSDICDPAPTSEGSAVPVFEVADGDAIKIQSGKVHTVELPTTAIELSGSARDASGNTTTGMAVLSITD